MRKTIYVVSIFLFSACSDETIIEQSLSKVNHEKTYSEDSLSESSKDLTDLSQQVSELNQSDTMLLEYDYPNLTKWGGITLKYNGKELKIIESKHNAELGFKKRTYYLKNSEFERIELITHQANWGAFYEKYGEDAELDDSKMTYIDNIVSYDSIDLKPKHSKELKLVVEEGDEILKFIEDEKINTANTRNRCTTSSI